MKRIVPVMVALALGAFGQSAAFAKGGGNAAAPSVSPPANSHAMANSNGPFSTDRDFGRDRAEDRMSANPSANGHAAANSNGRFSTDRDFGRDRAEDRAKVTHAKKPKKLASAKPIKPRAKPAMPATPRDVNEKA